MNVIEPLQGRPGVFLFFCPGCKCGHQFWTKENPDIGPKWSFNGDMVKPTVAPSIFVNRGRECPDMHACHSFVRNGMIQFLDDCSHELAGKIVELKPF